VTPTELTVHQELYDHTISDRRDVIVSREAFEVLRRESIRRGVTMEALIAQWLDAHRGGRR